MAEEQKIQSKLLAELKNAGFYAFKVHQANRSGIPDIIACKNGQFYAFECKSSNGKISRLQQYNLEEIAKCGGTGLIVSPDNIKNIVKFIQKWGS